MLFCKLLNHPKCCLTLSLCSNDCEKLMAGVSPPFFLSAINAELPLVTESSTIAKTIEKFDEFKPFINLDKGSNKAYSPL